MAEKKQQLKNNKTLHKDFIFLVLLTSCVLAPLTIAFTMLLFFPIDWQPKNLPSWAHFTDIFSLPIASLKLLLAILIIYILIFNSEQNNKQLAIFSEKHNMDLYLAHYRYCSAHLDEVAHSIEYDSFNVLIKNPNIKFRKKRLYKKLYPDSNFKTGFGTLKDDVFKDACELIKSIISKSQILYLNIKKQPYDAINKEINSIAADYKQLAASVCLYNDGTGIISMTHYYDIGHVPFDSSESNYNLMQFYMGLINEIYAIENILTKQEVMELINIFGDLALNNEEFDKHLLNSKRRRENKNWSQI